MDPQVPGVVKSKDPTGRKEGEYENSRTLKFGDLLLSMSMQRSARWANSRTRQP